MNGPGRKILLALGLAAYVIIVAALAVHYKFPYGPAAEAVKGALESQSPLRVSFDGPRPGAPFRYGMQNVELALKGPSEDMPLARFDRITFKLQPSGLLSGEARLAFTALSDGAASTGRLDYLVGSPPGFRFTVNRIDLPAFTLSGPQGSSVSGSVTGRIAVEARPGTSGFSGGGTIEMGQGRISGLQIPDLPLSELEFDRITLEFTLEGDQIKIAGLTVSGPQGGLNLSGQIQNLAAPNLQLKGEARMGPAEQPLASASIRVSGPAAAPNVRVSNVKGPGGLSLPGKKN